MSSKQEMMRRMKAVRDLRQMTRAMQLISRIKLRSAQKMLENAKPFFVHTIRTMNEIITQSPELFDPLFRMREPKANQNWRIRIILVAAEGGMAGAYSLKILRRAERLADDLKKKRSAQGYQVEFSFDTIGGKLGRRLTDDGYGFHEVIERWSSDPEYYMSQELGVHLLDEYLDEQVDEIYFVYMHMNNQVSSEPLYIRLLPVDPLGLMLLTRKLMGREEMEQEEEHVSHLLGRELHFEPNVSEVIKYLEGSYATAMVFGILNEAYAAEQSSRMQAMDSATNNADDLLFEMGQELNRMRQDGITEELTEIIAGAASV